MDNNKFNRIKINKIINSKISFIQTMQKINLFNLCYLNKIISVIILNSIK